MICLSKLLVATHESRAFVRTLCLAVVVSVLCACLSSAQAKLALQAIELPQSVVRSVIVDQSEWQGIEVELEHLQSNTTLEATLEQLAMLLPERTPVWSEKNVVRAHWSTAEASYSLFLWATENKGTEGLFSGLALRSPERLGHKPSPEQLVHNTSSNTSPALNTTLNWLPKRATQLFRFVDVSSGQPITLSSYTVPMVSSLLIQHLKTYAQRNGWLGLADELTFFRDAKRLSVQVTSEQGNTTVFFYETSRDAP